jgi:predicted enzyme related to lactoylglutathione lyase
MRRIWTAGIAGIAGALALTGAAGAQDTSVFAVRLGALDVPGLAEFYKTTFGLSEANRIEGPGFTEIMLNFGATPEEAQAAVGPQVVVMTRAEDNPPDALPHLIFHVADVPASVATFTANGGTVDREAVSTPGGSFAFVKDPEGNLVELLNLPAPE